MRLDKLLALLGEGTRSEIKAMVRAGRVTVDGQTAKDAGMQVCGEASDIRLDGRALHYKAVRHVMLNKPAGYVTSCDDPSGPTVMELIPENYRRLGVMPVGRLDKATEGLLLFTNDGVLAHRLISPRSGVWKTYCAEHDGAASQADVEAFAAGLTLGDGTKCLPAVLRPQGAGKSLIEVQEGKYHQVRRMMAARGMPVSYLERVSEGGITLDGLARGACRELPLEILSGVLDGGL